MAKRTRAERRRSRAQRRAAEPVNDQFDKQKKTEAVDAPSEQLEGVVLLAIVAATVVLFSSPALGLYRTICALIGIILVTVLITVASLEPGCSQRPAAEQWQYHTPQQPEPDTRPQSRTYSSATTGATYWTARVGIYSFRYQPIPNVSKKQFVRAVEAAAEKYSQLFMQTESVWNKIFSEELNDILSQDAYEKAQADHAAQQQQYYQQHKQQQQQQNNHRQQDQQRQRQRDQQQGYWHDATEVLQWQRWAAAAAAQPDLERLSARELLDVLHLVGAAIPPPPLDKHQLMDLAKKSLALWECKRLLCCFELGSKAAYYSVKVKAALCVFRVQCDNGKDPVTVARQASVVQAVEVEYKNLVRKVHPDKRGRDNQEHEQLFTEAFKAVDWARSLLREVAASKRDA